MGILVLPSSGAAGRSTSEPPPAALFRVLRESAYFSAACRRGLLCSGWQVAPLRERPSPPSSPRLAQRHYLGRNSARTNIRPKRVFFVQCPASGAEPSTCLIRS